MTRKDFQLIAGVLAERISAYDSIQNPVNPLTVQQAKESVYAVAYTMADRLAETNERFDRAKFLQASGVPA